MITALLVAIIGAIGVIGAALISRVGRVQHLVNGQISRLLTMIEDRDKEIARLRDRANPW